MLCGLPRALQLFRISLMPHNRSLDSPFGIVWHLFGSNSLELPVILFMSLMQPSDAAIPTAVEWAVGALLGSVATGVAVLAVAFLGFGMLFGHLDWRTGTRVVLGIFILFGAPMIARELAGFARSGEAAESGQVASGAILQQPAAPKNAPVADPYAGAGMSQR